MNDATDRAVFDSRRFLAGLTSRPGVYRMLNDRSEVLYVGKAGNLKKRISSYFSRQNRDPKTAALVSQIAAIEITVTNTEGEALLLENNLIKELRPRYNIMLRDDKSYPYIHLSSDQTFPRLGFHRGGRSGKGRYFGPYPSAGAVRASLNLLQKVFPVRQCEDSFFRNRSRPCLQHQIKRCTAPCVGLVTPERYAEDVRHAEMFLTGRSRQVVNELAREMEQAARKLRFERAAELRDQIATLQRIQEQQQLEGGDADLDILACVVAHGAACVNMVTIRDGRNLGDRAFFPKVAGQTSPEDVLGAFIPQYYLEREAPRELLVNARVLDKTLLEIALTERHGHRVTIRQPQRGTRVEWLKLAATNADLALRRRLATRTNVQERFEAMQAVLELPELPERIECFDISHTRGEAAVASCVVFDSGGPVKSDYRRFNIKDITAGDDYAAMHQAVLRRYSRIQKEAGKLPDLLLIDGGAGQLKRVAEALDELGLQDLPVVAVSKGPDRRVGEETLIRRGADRALQIATDSPALHLIQHIRDEAHRFAITGHRQRRARKREQSVLEEIPGLGPKRRQALLTRFGGLQALRRASPRDLASVPGISQTLAQAVYNHLHDTSS